MKSAFKTAAKIFKYASWLFVILYCGYIIYDDQIFIKQISDLSDFNLFMKTQLMYLLLFFTCFMFYYWVAALVIIFLYVKIYTPVKNVIKGMHN